MKLTKYCNAAMNRWEFSRRTTNVRSVPVDVQFEITTRCNLRCPMCEHSRWKEGLNKDMTYSDFVKLMGNFSNAYSIHFGGMGEVLLNRDFLHMIRYLKERKYYVGVVSNFSLMDSLMSEKILETGIDHVLVSFDAADAKTYKKIRVGGSFDIFIENLDHFISLRNAKYNSTAVSTNTVVNRYNQDHLGKIIERAREAGVTDMSFDKMVSFGSDGMEPDAINTTKLAEKYPDMNLKFGLFDTIQPKNCGSLWKTTVVLWNGDVLPCCMAMQRTIDRVPMGNLKKQTFKEIWNNKEFVAYRNCLKNNKKYGVCWRCAMV